MSEEKQKNTKDDAEKKTKVGRALDNPAAVDKKYMEHEKGSVADLVDLDFEDQAARYAAGQEEKTYGIWGPIWKVTKWYHSKLKPHTFKKKTYLLLLVFLGWIGGHRYYEGRWVLGLIYSAFFWTCIPLAMCILDAVAVIPLKPDDNGFITVG